MVRRAAGAPVELKFKNPAAPAEKREAEEDWGRKPASLALTQNGRPSPASWELMGPDPDQYGESTWR
jgi:hypothetical protein